MLARTLAGIAKPSEESVARALWETVDAAETARLNDDEEALRACSSWAKETRSRWDALRRVAHGFPDFISLSDLESTHRRVFGALELVPELVDGVHELLIEYYEAPDHTLTKEIYDLIKKGIRDGHEMRAFIRETIGIVHRFEERITVALNQHEVTAGSVQATTDRRSELVSETNQWLEAVEQEFGCGAPARIMELLLESLGKPVSYSSIIHYLNPKADLHDVGKGADKLASSVSRLRTFLAKRGSPYVLENVSGFGYKLMLPSIAETHGSR